MTFFVSFMSTPRLQIIVAIDFLIMFDHSSYSKYQFKCKIISHVSIFLSDKTNYNKIYYNFIFFE
jgi:hypothetical protein